MKAITLLITIAILLSVGNMYACSMFADICNGPVMLSDFSTMVTGEATWLRSTSNYNSNGWGAWFYHDEGYQSHNYQLLPDDNDNYFGPDDHYYRSPTNIGITQYPDVFDVVDQALNTSGKIFFAHARKAVDSPLTGAFVPFVFHDAIRDIDYSFGHHGSVQKDSMAIVIPGFAEYLNSIDPSLLLNFNQHVDSEYLFWWVIKNIMDKNGDVKAGLCKAFRDYQYYASRWTGYPWPKNQLNVFFSDGTGLYAYTNNYTTSHQLQYRTETGTNGKCYKIRSSTNTYLSSWYGNECSTFTLYYFPTHGKIQSYGNIYNNTDYSYSFKSGLNWIGFPVLTSSLVSANTALQSVNYYALHLQTKIPNMPNILTYDYYQQTQSWTDNPSVNRTQGYILELNSDLPTYQFFTNGSQTSYDTSLSFYANQETWVPYFIGYSQTPASAFGVNYSHVTSIYAQDWYQYKKGGKWYGYISPGATGTLDYGKMYKVTVDANFTQPWNHIGGQSAAFIPLLAQNFTYEEKPEYQAVEIDSIDSEEQIVEIGAFKDGVCVGAATVFEYPIHLQVYDEELPELLDYQIITASKNSETEYLHVSGNQVNVRDQVIRNGVPEFTVLNLRINHINTDIPLHIIEASVYPNPFKGTTSIHIESNKDTNARVSIYNSKGQKVLEAYNGKLTKGNHDIIFTGRNASGTQLAQGVYFMKLDTDSSTLTKKMLLVK
jgi:hypothetical protein